MKKIISRLALLPLAGLLLVSCSNMPLEVKGYRSWVKYSKPYYESLRKGNVFYPGDAAFVFVDDDCVVTEEIAQDPDLEELYGEIAHTIFYEINFKINKTDYTKYVSYANGKLAEISEDDGIWLFEESYHLVEEGKLNGKVGTIV